MEFKIFTMEEDIQIILETTKEAMHNALVHLEKKTGRYPCR